MNETELQQCMLRGGMGVVGVQERIELLGKMTKTVKRGEKKDVDRAAPFRARASSQKGREGMVQYYNDHLRSFRVFRLYFWHDDAKRDTYRFKNGVSRGNDFGSLARLAIFISGEGGEKRRPKSSSGYYPHRILRWTAQRFSGRPVTYVGNVLGTLRLPRTPSALMRRLAQKKEDRGGKREILSQPIRMIWTLMMISGRRGQSSEGMMT
jgi:hypothetical protein